MHRCAALTGSHAAASCTLCCSFSALRMRQRRQELKQAERVAASLQGHSDQQLWEESLSGALQPGKFVESRPAA